MSIQFSRQPRILPDMPSGTIKIQKPPAAQQKPDINWFTIVVPPLVMLTVTVFMALLMSSVFMMISIAMTIMTLITSLMNTSNQLKKFKKQKSLREERYLQYIKDRRSELELIRKRQTEASELMYPTPETCIARIETTDRQLFEKTEVFNDFMSVRAGRGNVPLAVHIDYEHQAIQMDEDPLADEPGILAGEFKEVKDVPVSLDFKKGGICGVTGEPEAVSSMMNTILLQMVTNHGYDDLRVVVLTTEDHLKDRMWLRFVPHIWDDRLQTRYLCCGKAMTHQVLGEIGEEIAERARTERNPKTTPKYLFIVEDESLLEGEAINKYLYSDHTDLGVFALFTAANQSYLPMNCHVFLNLSKKTGSLYDRESGQQVTLVPDQPSTDKLERAGLKLASIQMKSATGVFEIPEAISLMDMYGMNTMDDNDLEKRWKTNRTYYGISVPIGAGVGGKHFELDLHETGHGPHGLVAGTTGSGKSELLQTIIISLAMNYHPHDLSFILIDYKGGGMADVFEGMPHLVGTITNLGGNETTRALLSIKSEILQRQKTFSEYQVNNIDKYQKLYYSGQHENMPIVPHLVMIADEFAELKQDQPDFMKELVSAARVGRSLGIHLILATQKPAGIVDDQIWSNSKFKICLKVQDTADSKDVIKKPDAAYLKRPGRAYIQVGNDEIFELFQSAYSGADYIDPETYVQKKVTKRIYGLSLHGKKEKLYPRYEEKISDDQSVSQLEKMVEFISRVNDDSQIKRIEGPWKPSLDNKLTLNVIDPVGPVCLMDKPKSLVMPIGVFDDPKKQRQVIYNYDLMKDDHMVIYGASGTGKSHLMSLIALNAARRYTNEDLMIYGMDFGGTSLKKMDLLPSCGGVVTLEEEDKINHLIYKLEDMQAVRKGLFQESRVDSISEYRSKVGNLPNYLVFMDNYYAFGEVYPDLEERFQVLLREGLRFGLNVVMTVQNTSLVSYRTVANFKTAVALNLVDDSEYNNILGRTEGLKPMDLPGRGLVKVDYAVELQTADHVYEGLDYDDLADRLVQAYQEKGIKACRKIPQMEDRIRLALLVSEEDREAFNVGRDFRSLLPVNYDIGKHFVTTVLGSRDGAAYQIVHGWFREMNRQDYFESARYYCIDNTNMDLYDITLHENCQDITDESNYYDNTLELREMLEARKMVVQKAKKDRQDVDVMMQDWSAIVLFIADYSKYADGANYQMMNLVDTCLKEYRQVKLHIIIVDSYSDLGSNYAPSSKIIKEEQAGILLGSMHEQNVYNVKVPYLQKEKLDTPLDGYLVEGSQYVSMRFGV